ncbi:zf-TFIIB domain-containing protein [soil metagenome]
MKCPIDQNPLQITERQGVEIDYCPACRGVWLDRGELDKIIDRVEGTSSAFKNSDSSYRPEPDRKYYGKHGKRRKEGFFGELFDF